MDRRHFFKLSYSASATYLVLRLTGCKQAADGSLVRGANYDANSVQVYDLTMKGLGYPDGEYLGDNGTLKASMIAAHQEVTLPYVQDDHGHVFTLKPEDFSALLLGKSVQVVTTVALDHQHYVTIDPADRDLSSSPVTLAIDGSGNPVTPGAGGGQPPTQPTGQQPVTQQPPQPVTVTQPVSQPQPINQPPPPAAGRDQGFAGLSEAQQPYLYVSSSTQLQDGTVQFCLASPDQCNANPTLWNQMQRTARTDKQIYVSGDTLGLDQVAPGTYPVTVRATAQDGHLVQFVLNLISK